MLNDGGMRLVRASCRYCKTTHNYFPTDLIQIFEDVDVDSLMTRIKCENGDHGRLKVEAISPTGKERLGCASAAWWRSRYRGCRSDGRIRSAMTYERQRVLKRERKVRGTGGGSRDLNPRDGCPACRYKTGALSRSAIPPVTGSSNVLGAGWLLRSEIVVNFAGLLECLDKEKSPEF
jgi:hypothetical protein